MLHSARALNGMVTAPHHLAAQAGRDILRLGGSAVEAAVAVASTLTAVYPHMTGIGGDGFWLIRSPDGRVISIDACGRAAMGATPELYAGLDTIPWRGPLAANTVAGTVAGWRAALDYVKATIPLDTLFGAAIAYAEQGILATESMSALMVRHHEALQDVSGYASCFLKDGVPIRMGERHLNPALGQTFRRLAKDGLESFYRGAIGEDIAADLQAAGSPVRLIDLEQHDAEVAAPLTVRLADGTFYNMRPPTQGAASLLILALAERLGAQGADTAEEIHKWVEATKLAFIWRDSHVTDPEMMPVSPQVLLDDSEALTRMTQAFDPEKAAPWPYLPQEGDTTWFGVVDSAGWSVSVIQSLYFEFGSGVVLPKTGIVWQNRGASFDLRPGRLRSLVPGRKPFHTLNPAMAELIDGSVMTYGTMGGEGQPQTQSAVVARAVRAGIPLQAAITAPRWLLGRTWGETTTSLKLESRFDAETIDQLRRMGHDVEVLAAFTDTMGHAGAIRRYADGSLEGATDPRSDGAVAAW